MVRFEDSASATGGESVVGDDDGLAPVIPLFGSPGTSAPVRGVGDLPADRVPARRAGAPSSSGTAWNTSWTDDAPADTDGAEPQAREAAEKMLLKKLRTRSLSEKEARAVLRQHDLDETAIESVVAAFLARGYLDDAALAEQLIHAGVDRKGQGRQAIGQTLAQRGIARDVAEAALADLPNDDADRALEFARTKARSMASLDRDTALRRLSGQLARRGYGGSVAFDAARRALDEVAPRSRTSSSASSVRFE